MSLSCNCKIRFSKWRAVRGAWCAVDSRRPATLEKFISLTWEQFFLSEVGEMGVVGSKKKCLARRLESITRGDSWRSRLWCSTFFTKMISSERQPTQHQP